MDLNKFILNTEQFTKYTTTKIINKDKVSEIYPKLFKLASINSINLTPYILTLNNHDLKPFLVFLNKNIKTINKNISIKTSKDIDDIFSESIDYLLILIFSIQFFYV